jgi:sugar transferase (PEP-CTERM/EpsH1 system associated)
VRILFLTPRFPYPPLKGDKLRAYHQIRHLAARREIALVSFIETEHEKKWIPELAKYCYRIETVLLRPVRSYLNMAMGALSGLPFQCLFYRSPKMRQTIREIAEAERPDVVHVQLARMAPYASQIAPLPTVIDLVDALALNFKRRLARERPAWKPLVYLEWKRTERYEKQVSRLFNQMVVTSPADMTHLPAEARVVANPNGVDTEYFSYISPGSKDIDTIIFTGNMGYFPNIDAVDFFCREVFPHVKKAHPRVQFLIVGANPHGRVLELGKLDGVHVVGYVEDIREFLGRAAIAVCPMKAGSGIQNKVLEALAMGTPVVATSQAVAALEVTHVEHVLIADTAEDFAEQVARLLGDPLLRKRLGKAGRALVEERYTWEASVNLLEETYARVLRA